MNIIHMLLAIAGGIILVSTALFMFCLCQIAGESDKYYELEEETSDESESL